MGLMGGLLLATPVLTFAQSPPKTVAASVQRSKAVLFPTQPRGLSVVLRDGGARGIDEVVGRRLALRYQERGEAFETVPLPSAELCSVQDDCLWAFAKKVQAEVYHRALWTRTSTGGCQLALLRIGANTRERIEASIPSCRLDETLETARKLADRSARPLTKRPVDAPLSLVAGPDLHIPSIPVIEHSTTSTRSSSELAQVLDAYLERAVFYYYDEEEKLRFVQNKKLLSECSLRKSMGTGVPPKIKEFCEGNDWAWAFAGVPVGGAIAIATFPSLEQESLTGFLGVTTGVLAAATFGALGISQWRLPHDASSGEYYSSHPTLIRLAERGNRALREKLKLSKAEVRWLLSPANRAR